MSISTAPVPPWKQSLLDKKRRQEEENRRLEKEEVDKFSSLPNWKRDLLLKRHGQKNSMVFVGRRKSSEESPERKPSSGDTEQGRMTHENELPACNHISIIDAVDNDLQIRLSQEEKQNSYKGQNGESQEHLLPVKENPWLKADPVKKKRFSDNPDLRRSHSKEPDVGNHSSWSGEVDILKDMRNETDDVFDEEVTYGKGFVHKLLRKFSHLTSQEDRGRKNSRHSTSRRSHSAENLLDDRSRSSSGRRELSPSGSYSDSLSPRSPSRSRSNDSISSPRGSEENTQLSHKTSSADKSGISTSVCSSQDKEQHSAAFTSSGSSLLSPSWENISELEDSLPKKNIVSSTRNVFENKISPRAAPKKPAPRVPSPVRSPRNSVHTLIAVENLGTENQTHRSPTVSPSVTFNDKPPAFDKENRAVKVPVRSEPTNEPPRENRSSVIVNGQTDIAQSVKYKNATDSKTENRRAESESKSSAPSYFELYFKKSSQSSANEAKSSCDSSSNLVDGDVSANLREQTDNSCSDTVTSLTGPSYKKRKAPLPPKPSTVKDKRPASVTSDEEFVDTSEITLRNTIITNGIVNGESELELKQNSVKTEPVVSQSRQFIAKPAAAPIPKPRQNNVNAKQTSAPDAKRQNLSLNLNEISEKPEVVKSSAGSSNDAYSVINKNKKAKIVTPKSTSGPGSLLIRPASNMIQAKNAQFAKLEFKYDDIRTGDFAPPKKKPSHYDDDTDSDDDIPVTNIDDVIDGNVDKSRSLKDKNANMAKKSGKYEFIGAGVVSGKSSLAKRRKTTKANIQFDEHNCITYEYPSEQSLMSETPARPGDYDYVDSTMLNGKHDYDSDDDDDETMTIDVEQVSTKSLKSNPAVGSSGVLSGYQSKMQFEYHFGMNMNEEPARPEEKVVQPEMTEHEYIKPADEDETANWSETQSADLLF